METEKVEINSDGKEFGRALEVTEELAANLQLPPKEALRLRLLMEELLGMLREIVTCFQAKVWLESREEERQCCIYLQVDTMMDAKQKKELLEVSTSGKNMANTGIMGRIRGLFETGMDNYADAKNLQMQYGTGYINFGVLGMVNTNMSNVYYWSLNKYKDSLKSAKKDTDSETLVEAWDELEKSIVANLADEIKVGITKDKLDLIIEKKW